MISDGGFSGCYDVVKHFALQLGAVGIGVQLRRGHDAGECVCVEGEPGNGKCMWMNR